MTGIFPTSYSYPYQAAVFCLQNFKFSQ